MMNTLRSTFLLAVVLVLSGFLTTVAFAQSQMQFASGWSVNNNGDWTPFPPNTNPLSGPNDTCTGASAPTGSWAEFTFSGFTLPATDIVLGIEVRVNYLSASGSNTVQLTKSGPLVGNTRTVASVSGQSFCSNTAWVTAGTPTDLWGTTWTVADFNSGNVGFRLTQDASTVDIDAVEIIVHHRSGTNSPPTADAGTDQTVECAGPSSAVVLLDGTGSSDPDGDALTYTWTGPFSEGGGTTFGATPTVTLPLGMSTITLEVDDGNGGTDTDTVDITVEDTTDPVITLNGDDPLTLECSIDTYVEPGATAVDACVGAVSATPSGTVDETTSGTYFITYTASDGNGNTAMDTRTVEVEDTTDPVITVLGDNPLTLECGVDDYDEPGATALDACDGAVSATPSGTVDTDTPGTYMITYTATDAAGNTATDTRTVEVVDTTPPEITLNGDNPLTLECAVDGYVEPGAVVTDGCDDDPELVITGTVDETTPGTYFITYTATDASGNESVETRTVEVVDTIAPEITLAAGPIELWPPNHKYRTIGLDDIVTGASDLCDTDVSGDDVVTASASSDEEENATGDGNTLEDIVIAGDCRSVDLRAERQGSSNGRVYALNLAVADASGNVGTASFGVHVPHSKKSGAVDDGPAYSLAGCTAVPAARVVSTAETEALGTAPVEQVEGTPAETPVARLKGAPEETLDVQEVVPTAYVLEGNYPNPFNPMTTIRFSMPESAPVKLTVYDVLGRQVLVLVDGTREAGTHEVVFDARALPSGTYLVQLTTPKGSFVQTMQLMK